MQSGTFGVLHLLFDVLASASQLFRYIPEYVVVVSLGSRGRAIQNDEDASVAN